MRDDFFHDSTVLSWIGILLSLPSFVGLFFFGPYRSLALIALVFSALILLYAWQLNAPAWEIIELHKILHINDVEGRNVSITLHRVIRPMHSHLSEYRMTNLNAPGSMTNFRVDGKPINPNCIENERGEYALKIVFDPPIQRRKTKRITLTYDCIDSFMDPEKESTMYRVNYPTRRLLVEINLHPNRPAIRTKCVHNSESGKREMSPLPELQNGTKIVWEAHKLKALQEYIVYWWYT